MLLDRVISLRRVLMFEPHRYRHVSGRCASTGSRTGSPRRASNFLAVRIMHDGDTSLFATGRYLDRIDMSGRTPFRFIERTVVLDSQKIDTLLVIPL